jgi:excisionase family DNA binding protein
MPRINVTERKGPGRAAVVHENKILVGRHEAAEMLSISCRALDYLVAHKELSVRRIGSRVLIPVSDLQRFSQSDHPERLVG